jgi:hypothetical protein
MDGWEAQNYPADVAHKLYGYEHQLKYLTMQLARRKGLGRRARLGVRIQNCEARIAALKLAYR